MLCKLSIAIFVSLPLCRYICLYLVYPPIYLSINPPDRPYISTCIHRAPSSPGGSGPLVRPAVEHPDPGRPRGPGGRDRRRGPSDAPAGVDGSRLHGSQRTNESFDEVFAREQERLMDGLIDAGMVCVGVNVEAGIYLQFFIHDCFCVL